MMAKKTGRKKVIVMEGGHHGNTIFFSNGGSSMGRENVIAAKMPRFVHPASKSEAAGLWEECACGAERLIREHRGDAACMIIEPIQGRGGNMVPTRQFFRVLSEAARSYEVPIIADEVQTGVGRTGYFFACDAFGFEPDAIVLAKGLTGCGFPLGVVLYDSGCGRLEPGTDGFTFGSNLLSVAAARETIKIVNNPIFLGKVKQKGSYIMKNLTRIRNRLPRIGDIRGMGLFMGIKSEGWGEEEFANALLGKNVIARTGAGIIKIRPPLTIGREEMDFLLNAIEGVFDVER